METEGRGDLDQAIRFGYQCALAKDPDAETIALLRDLHEEVAAETQAEGKAALMAYQEGYQGATLENPMAVVANAILNLDAFVVKN